MLSVVGICVLTAIPDPAIQEVRSQRPSRICTAKAAQPLCHPWLASHYSLTMKLGLSASTTLQVHSATGMTYPRHPPGGTPQLLWAC